MKHWETPSRSSPQGGGTRGCLCKNMTYSRKCCDGTLRAQGIGNITRTSAATTRQWQEIQIQWNLLNDNWEG